MTEVLHLGPAELAVMCVLLLRGPQTSGELTTRGFRLHEFSGLEEVDAALNALITREPDPLVIRLPRQPGQKEVRFAHLLSGEVAIDTQVTERAASTSHRTSSSDRVAQLEADSNSKTESQIRSSSRLKKQLE